MHYQGDQNLQDLRSALDALSSIPRLDMQLPPSLKIYWLDSAEIDLLALQRLNGSVSELSSEMIGSMVEH